MCRVPISITQSTHSRPFLSEPSPTGALRRPARFGTVALRLMLGLIGFIGLLPAAPGHAAEALHVGSKRFTESYILGEILARTATAQGTPAEHLQGLGNTAIVFAALKAGSIDVYPEYLGTIDAEILKHTTPASLDTINRELAPLGLGVAVPLGFANSYALAVRKTTSAQKGIRRLSDLKTAPGLRFGLSHEFIGRADGWPGMAQRYGLTAKPVGLDHGIAYGALADDQIDVMDIYSTDARIASLGLVVLDDDLHYFPPYDAVLLYRLDLPVRFPRAWQAMRALQGKIPAANMIEMNAAVEIGGSNFARVADEFLAKQAAPVAGSDAKQGNIGIIGAPGNVVGKAAATADSRPAPGGADGFAAKLFDEGLWRLTRQHLILVLVSVSIAALVGIPLGVLAAFVPRLEQVVMAAVGVLQTVPSLALLAMLIPLLGRIGAVPALIALFLYALLPIVRNTCTGMLQVPPGLRMAALALGLRSRDRLLFIDLPLAMPMILAGLKTAAVMSVGTATIAAFIGAGGYGERIAIGLALNDNGMLLAGAIPAAVLALLTQGLFELIEWRLRRPRK